MSRLLLAFVALAASIAHAQVFNWKYELGGGLAFQCEHSVQKGRLFNKCANKASYVVAETLTIPVAVQKTGWRQFCGGRCLERNLNSSLTPSTDCVGFFLKSSSVCQLMECPSGVAAGPTSKPKSRRPPKNPPSAVVMPPSCFTPLATPSPTRTSSPTRPTTRAPTRRPVSPTAAPFRACAVTGPFAAEFDFLQRQNLPAGMDKYTLVTPNRNLCEFIRPRSMTDGKIHAITGFTCTVEACVRWCSADSNCLYAMFSPKLQLCYKSGNLELTDDEIRYAPYYTEEWTVLRKTKSTTDISYYAGKCAELAMNTCNGLPECGWNRGRMGYNDPTQGGGVGGYCGRVRCLAAEGDRG